MGSELWFEVRGGEVAKACQTRRRPKETRNGWGEWKAIAKGSAGKMGCGRALDDKKGKWKRNGWRQMVGKGWVGEGRGAQRSDGAKTLVPTTRGEYAPTQRRMHQRADACAGSKQEAPNMSPRLRRLSARTPRPNMPFNQSAHASTRRRRRPDPPSPPTAIEKQSFTRRPHECKTRPWPCPTRNAPRARNVANIHISARTNRRQVVSHMMATSANICHLDSFLKLSDLDFGW